MDSLPSPPLHGWFLGRVSEPWGVVHGGPTKSKAAFLLVGGWFGGPPPPPRLDTPVGVGVLLNFGL